MDGEVESEIYISEVEIDFLHHQQHYNNNSATTDYQKKDSLENNSTTHRVIGDKSRQSGLGVAWRSNSV